MDRALAPDPAGGPSQRLARPLAHAPARGRILQGLVVFAAGAAALMVMAWGDVLGGSTTPLFLGPWIAVIGGLWWAATSIAVGTEP